MIKQLDRQQATQGNTKVIYLKYAKASDLVEVLTGISSTMQSEKQAAKPVAALDKNIIIKAHGQTNALIVTAAPDVMNDLERVIAQLDIRRPQVLVEAIIAEVQDADGLNLGIQWANKNAGMTQFTNSGLPDIHGHRRGQPVQQRRHRQQLAGERLKLLQRYCRWLLPGQLGDAVNRPFQQHQERYSRDAEYRHPRQHGSHL